MLNYLLFLDYKSFVLIELDLIYIYIALLLGKLVST